MENNLFIKEEINVRAHLKTLWERKKIIFMITSVITFISIFYSLLLPNIYASSALLKPNDYSSNPAMMSQYSNLANLTGINIPNGTNNNEDVQLAIALLSSKDFLKRFIESRKILPDLMAFKSWDSDSNEIHYNSNYNPKDGTWIESPSIQKAIASLIKTIDIDINIKTSYITLTVEHRSPIIAKDWVAWLTEDVNAQIATMRISEAQSSNKYLENLTLKTPYVELKNMFYQIIQENTKTIMLANVRQEYVLSTIDPPVISEDKIKPNRSSIVLMSFFMSFIFSIILVLVSNVYRDTIKKYIID